MDSSVQCPPEVVALITSQWLEVERQRYENQPDLPLVPEEMADLGEDISLLARVVIGQYSRL